MGLTNTEYSKIGEALGAVHRHLPCRRDGRRDGSWSNADPSSELQTKLALRSLHLDPQAEPSTVRERIRFRVLLARAALDGPAFAAMRSGLRLGSHLGTSPLLKMLAHPQWLFGSAARVPRRPVTFTEPTDPSGEDMAMCTRIMRAYRLARDDRGGLPPIWSKQIDRYYGALERALLDDDPEALLEQFRWMFRRPFLVGITTPIDYEDPAAPLHWALMTYDRLVSLAEAIGVIGLECPEQGVSGRAFVEDIDLVPGRIEANLGISIDYPRVGAPFGILIGGRLVTADIGKHLHTVVRLREAIETHLRRSVQGVRVLEIGGGFGGAAMWYLRLLGELSGTYTIVDLPLMNSFQAYFLAKIHGPDAIQLLGEDDRGAPIRILPPQALAAGSVLADVVFNQDSMPEMSELAARGYLTWIADNVTGLFFSCNQEAETPVGGIAQHVVATLARQTRGLERISRQPSWVRRGYVEETYRCERMSG